MMKQGTTLIEAIVALVLVAIVMPVTLRAISLANAAARRAVLQTTAAELARSKLAELVATGAWQGSDLQGDFLSPPSGQVEPDTAIDLLPYRWDAAVEQWTDPMFDQLTVNVRWEHMGAQHVVKLSTLVPVQEQ